MTTAKEKTANSDTNAPVKLVDARAVCDRIGVGRTKFLEMVASGQFPSPTKIGARCLWRTDDISHWIDEVTGRTTGQERAQTE